MDLKSHNIDKKGKNKSNRNKPIIIDLTTITTPPSTNLSLSKESLPNTIANITTKKNPLVIDLTDTDSNTTTIFPSNSIPSCTLNKNVNLPLQPQSQSQPSLSSKSCPICLLELTDPSATWCGHIFCWKCIRKAQKSASCCPVCREPLSARQYHRIYL